MHRGEFLETTLPHEAEMPPRRFLVRSNVSGQVIKEWTTAKNEEEAIENVARRLQAKHPKTSYLYSNFKKKAEAREMPLEEREK
ncbi:hypothetical protein COT68_01450 [bacterium (Candidatus Torokbacteria) CG09_land_8_20_14_0_10_42_11]|nr:MAG: hypothetical protein COT68_01450 [bacterium (Candidatus Torokbacteria) CG09_land_8_20_14_0_10_42_11]